MKSLEPIALCLAMLWCLAGACTPEPPAASPIAPSSIEAAAPKPNDDGKGDLSHATASHAAGKTSPAQSPGIEGDNQNAHREIQNSPVAPKHKVAYEAPEAPKEITPKLSDLPPMQAELPAASGPARGSGAVFEKHFFNAGVDDSRLCHVCGESIYHANHKWQDPKEITPKLSDLPPDAGTEPDAGFVMPVAKPVETYAMPVADCASCAIAAPRVAPYTQPVYRQPTYYQPRRRLFGRFR